MEQGYLKTAGVVMLAIISIAFIYYYFFILSEQDTQISQGEFVKELEAAKKVYIISDLRNAPISSRNGIMQCGIDIAGSIALAPKNVSYFVIDGNDCITEHGNRSISFCEDISKNGVLFYIKYGNSTSFYKNKIVVGMNNYTTPCGVTQKKQ